MDWNERTIGGLGQYTRTPDFQTGCPLFFNSGIYRLEDGEMKLAELYREWVAGGVNFGGVPQNGETKYMHRSELALAAIEELEADAKRYRWLRERNAQLLRAIAYGSKAACQVDKGPDETMNDWTDRTIDAARSEEPT